VGKDHQGKKKGRKRGSKEKNRRKRNMVKIKREK
jgi:hypothetical protein